MVKRADKMWKYRGVYVTQRSSPGVMPYGAYVGGKFVYADTREGIKALIRDNQGGLTW